MTKLTAAICIAEEDNIDILQNIVARLRGGNNIDPTTILPQMNYADTKLRA